MKLAAWFSATGLAIVLTGTATAQSLDLPKQVEAGTSFSIPTTGSGKAVLYIVGFGQVLRQDVDLGQPVSIAPGALPHAGQYLAVLTGGASAQGQFSVVPSAKVASVSFLAKPSRLPVNLHGGISGAVYVFDAYHNLVLTPQHVSFELANGAAAAQSSAATTEDGRAWTQMNSATREGKAEFTARVGDVASTRIIQQVPGDPCGLIISAQPAGPGKVALTTAPLKDCSGNPVPDGTIVTFTETYNGEQSTVDVPLKRGVAQTVLPAVNGARISAATGVVLGNEIHWGGRS